MSQYCRYLRFYHFLIFTYIWQYQGFKEYDNNNFEKDFENEFKNYI